jgi:hypothetical protein
LAQKVATDSGFQLNRATLKMGLAIVAGPQTDTSEHGTFNKSGISTQSKWAVWIGKDRCKGLEQEAMALVV